jgi:peptidase inhibitor family I36
MKRKIFVAVTGTTAAAAALTLIMAAAGPSAGAAERSEKSREKKGPDCPSGAVCLYTEKDYRGKVLIDRKAEEVASYGDANDTFSSVINRSRKTVCFNTEEDFEGVNLELVRFFGYPDLEAYDEVLRSHRPC